ncbi:MAG: hypothetical protein ACU0BF_05205 [Paracoccaceae bacterium]
MADGAGDGGRAALEERWLELTRNELPGVAAERRWPVRFDHCFQRILLDHAAGGVWYDAITGRPAYAHAPRDLLARAVAAGEGALAGAESLSAMNDASLAWRRARRG